MEIIILLCLLTEPDCKKETATQYIRLPVQHVSTNCGHEAQTYVVKNGVDLTGVKMVVRCRLGGN